MINSIIDGALRKSFLVVVATLAVIAYGLYSIVRLNMDAFPDVTNIQVQINTSVPGLAAVEVEKLISFPVESVMNGLPDITMVRSISKAGLSVVTVIFKDDVDIYFARQLILERLQLAKERIPEGLAEPEMGPITSGLGQIFKYVLEGEGKTAMELRTINDWLVKFQLRTVPGVTDVLSFGGEVRQYQVQVNPNNLVRFGLTLADLRTAISENNTNAGGWYLEGAQEQLVVRGVGLIRGGREGLTDIENIVVKIVEGTPVLVRHVARVEYGSEIRQGALTMNGKGEVVMGIVLQLKGANTKKVIDHVKVKIEAIQDALPDGVRIIPVYDQADLVDKAVHTVTKALSEASILIVIVLFLFLWNARSTIVVLFSIPISMLIAFTMMRWYGLSANLQSLGGLAIGIGMMVDGSVVMVENIVRHLSEPNPKKLSVSERVMLASHEVGQPVFFAVLIIVVVFLPLFTLTGVEGKLFSPMAFTIAFAMLGSLVVALTIVPVVSALIFPSQMKEEDSFVVTFSKNLYQPILGWVMGHRAKVIGIALVSLISSFAILPFLGTEFVPELNEGTMDIRVTMFPSISLEEAKRIGQRLEEKLLKYPEVTYVFSQIGRAELGGDPEPISNNEIFVGFKPQSEWTTASSREEMIQILEKDLGEHPGLMMNFSQPIATRVDELLSGVKAQIAIKLFGDDLKVLEAKGKEIEAVVKSVTGASDVQMEQMSGEAQLVIEAKRRELALYGLNISDVMEVVSTGIGGEAVSEIIEGQRRFDVYLRVDKKFRNSPKAIGALWVTNSDGMRVPLAQVADIRLVDGSPMINRENAQRRIVIQCNVRDRDMGSFVEDARQAIKSQVDLPPGYFLTYGGQFENQQRAQKTLMVVVPLSLALIFMLLFISFNSAKNAFLIIMNVPFAMIGGIIALAVSGQYLSVPSSVGFIALFGVAVLNGVVMVSYFNQLVAEGMPIDQAVREGAMTRLRPVLMTAMVASLGLIPLLLATGIGSEVQRPLATVVVGGLITSTLLTLLVLPAIYEWFADPPKRDA